MSNVVEPSQKRGRYKHRPKSNGDNGKYLDYVNVAEVLTKAVGSEDRQNPLATVVQVQKGSNRQPRDFYHPPNPTNILELNPGVKPAPEGCKYCINCGEWRKFDRFSPDMRSRDKLHSWCKACRNEQARRHYWAAKHTAIPAAA